MAVSIQSLEKEYHQGYTLLNPTNYIPKYLFSKYPDEKTKLWSLKNLLSPISWMWTFISIASICLSLVFITFIGMKMGLGMS